MKNSSSLHALARRVVSPAWPLCLHLLKMPEQVCGGCPAIVLDDRSSNRVSASGHGRWVDVHA
jgi:hypothetical protein